MIAFLCNGEKWEHIGEIRELALNYGYHYYITDSVAEVSEVLAKITEEKIKIICVLGGDGTVCQLVTPIFKQKKDVKSYPIIGLLGGGTMDNVKIFLKLKGSPPEIARKIILSFQEGNLPTKTIPLLKIEHNNEIYYGFMFYLGPIVRLLKKYTDYKRNVVYAFLTAAGSSSASLFKWPKQYYDLIYLMKAKVTIDGHQNISSSKMSVILASTIPRTVFGFYPFLGVDSPAASEKFYTIVSSFTSAKIIKNLPYLAYLQFWEKWGVNFFNRFSSDFFNRLAEYLIIETEEKIFSIDGEIFEIKKGQPIKISQGPEVSLYSPK